MPRKTILFLIVAVAVLCLQGMQAHAQTSRVYFAGYMGLNTYNDQEFDESSVPVSGDIELKNAMSFAGALGIRLSRQVRLEAELSFSETEMDRLELGALGGFDLGGEIRTYLTMLNVYYDFDVPWSVQPFIGGGLGFAWHEGDIDDLSGLAVDASDDATGIAWQLGGGLKYRVNPDMAFSSGYRYIDGTDLDFGSYSIDYGSHEFRIGLEYDLPFE